MGVGGGPRGEGVVAEPAGCDMGLVFFHMVPGTWKYLQISPELAGCYVLLLDDFGFRIETFDGYLLFSNNAYLIKGADGDWYPKGELTFNARYKEVKE